MNCGFKIKRHFTLQASMIIIAGVNTCHKAAVGIKQNMVMIHQMSVSKIWFQETVY